MGSDPRDTRGYDPHGVCNNCGCESKFAKICGECEVAERYEAKLATLHAENERLKGELAERVDADGILQSLLEAAQLEIDEGKAWRQRAEHAEGELREAQATIERVREAISTHIPEPPSHAACSTELERRLWALLCELDHVFALHAERMQKLAEEVRKGGENG